MECTKPYWVEQVPLRSPLPYGWHLNSILDWMSYLSKSIHLWHCTLFFHTKTVREMVSHTCRHMYTHACTCTRACTDTHTHTHMHIHRHTHTDCLLGRQMCRDEKYSFSCITNYDSIWRKGATKWSTLHMDENKLIYTTLLPLQPTCSPSIISLRTRGFNHDDCLKVNSLQSTMTRNPLIWDASSSINFSKVSRMAR